MVHRLALLPLLLASSVIAQSLLPVPASHAAVEGTSATNVPFGRSTPTRVQYAYDASLFAGPATITGLAFRIDGLATAASKVVDCELRLSTMATTLLGLNADYAQNRGPDETVVLPRQLLTLPAQTTLASPNAFLPSIALATPFAYDPANGGLLLEVVVYGQPPGAYSLDVTYVCDSPEVAVGPLSCLQSTGVPLRVESATTQVIWGRPWVSRVLDAPPGSLVVLSLGSIEAGSWGGFVLPFDLAPLGGPGCFLSIDLAGLWYSVAANDGSAVFPFVVPNSPMVVGEWIRFQAAAFDATANALGLVTSQARKVQVCGWEPVGRVWGSGTTAQFGTREIGLGAVLQLTVQ
ncbi:MAG TPA: hypothetical protein VFZ65_18775 [Planctomycetota bacterium]|nr:hypothetical protein [Planctomycetota bacterium]